MSGKNSSNKKTGGNRIQIRVQEFVKKLHPDVLRTKLRHFRKFVISATADKRNTNSSKEEPSTSNLINIKLPLDCDSSKAVAVNNVPQETLNHRFEEKLPEFSKTSKLESNEKQANDNIDELFKMDGNICVPNVIVEKDGLNSNSEEQNSQNSPSNNLQLAINIEAAPRNKSPITVQEWVDSLPLTLNETSRDECDLSETNVVQQTESESDNLTLGAEARYLCNAKPPAAPTPPVNVTVTSCQESSEVESHCSSVDSLLEARKPDPEEILLSLGFGGTASSSYLETGRIPKRFLKQSQLKGVDIEEFIRQQQDLIYTFESGSYGYRGLAGPSHSNPSVIVAKILEKLREHEREATSMTSYQPDFRKHCSLEKNPENPVNRFSKVARNVLTKIRCTPGSVLTPDNRRWLDSQGNKSPEISRRLIIGQQSFTFGRDGDLIEASNNDDHKAVNQNINDEIDEISSEEKNDELKNADEDLEDLDNSLEQSYIKNNYGRRCTDSSTDMSVESMIMRSDYLSRSVEFSTNPENLTTDVENLDSENVESTPRNSTLKRSNPVDLDEPIDNLDLSGEIPIQCNTNEISSSDTSNNEIDKRSLFVANSLPECESGIKAYDVDEDSREMSLKEELENSGVPLNSVFIADQSSIKKLKNVLTRYSSFEESIKETSDEEVNTSEDNSNEYPLSEKMDQYADSATESEIASYPHRSLINKNIHRQYEELTLLESKLHSLGRPLKVITEDQFSTISSKQRSALQSQIIREALKVYLNQLTEDEMHLELKNCLSAEAQKVADLLDSSSDASKLTIIVRQMTLLLQHQSQLSAQIKELSAVDKKPSSCHEMCDHILKRVHELELLVQQNAQELAQMKYQLLSKNKF